MLKSVRDRAKSWVMVSPTQEGFVKLPNEKVLYTSPPRTTLALSTPNSFPGAQPWSVKSDGGIVYVTNQRIVYLPTTPTPELQNFSCPILNLQDTYVRAPFFGANYWTAVVRPVAGGGIPPSHPYVELRMTFREGGAYDYHTTFEQIKERLHHAVSLARDDGRNVGSVAGLGGVDLTGVHLEQLPAYEPAREITDGEHADERGLASPHQSVIRDSGVSGVRAPSPPKAEEEVFTPPNEPPPGYEEAQVQAVGIDLDQRLREEAERQ